MKLDAELLEKLAKVRRAALLVGVVGAFACAAGYATTPDQFFPSYLVGYLFWWSIALGSLAIAMIHHLTGGGWGMAIRRILEAAYGTLPLLAILFLPLMFGIDRLYIWAQPSVMAGDALLQKKAAYLNVEFFQIRTVIYFAIWLILGFLMNWITSGTDPAEEPRRRRLLGLIAGPGMMLWTLSVTFSAVDWVMSLEPHWFSSMYGVLYMGAQGVAGLSTALITVILLRKYRPWSEEFTVERQHDLGNFLLAFTLFWSYVSFMQFIIIWSGNLPEETPWYLRRATGGWQFAAIALAALHFVTPFLLLLSRVTKRDPKRLIRVAVLLLVMRWIDLCWLILPTFRKSLSLHWMDIAAPVAIGGLWIAMYTWRLEARGPLPVFDLPESEESRDEIAHTAH